MKEDEDTVFYQELKEIGIDELLESITRALGLAALISSPDGRPLARPFSVCSFCALLDGNTEAQAMCEASRAASARAAAVTGEEVLRACHAGLVYLAAPLQSAEETAVAVVLVGSAALQPLSGDTVDLLARDMGIDGEKLRAAAGTVPVWTQERLRTAAAMVKRVVITVARLLDAKRQLGRRADQLAALFEFSKAVSGSLQVAEVARRGLEEALVMTGATSGSVVMLSEEVAGALSSEVAVAVETCDGFQGEPPGEVVATVEREAGIMRFDSRPEGRSPEERRPAAALPLVVGGKVTGVLTIAGRPGGEDFAEDETVFLTTLGASLGVAMENARLFRRLQARTSMLEQLIEVGRVLSTSLDVDAVVESGLAKVRDVLGVQWCALRLLDEETGELVLKAGLGMSAELQARTGRVRPDGTPMGEVIRTGKPVVVEDLAADGSGLHLPYYAVEVQALAVVPVKVGGRILGTLKIYSPTARRWSEEEVGYLTTIASQAGLALENARIYSELRRHYNSAVLALASALEAKDAYTRGHSLRVARLSRACARMLGLDAKEQEQVYLAGLLHDVGKIGVSEDILFKPGPLTVEERREMQGHPVKGAGILEPAGFPKAVVAAVRHHHEDYGGGGYPAGLAGEEIPILARIIRVADAYDAMMSSRPYREAQTARRAGEELRQCTGRQFDPRVIEAFLVIPRDEMECIAANGGIPLPARIQSNTELIPKQLHHESFNTGL